MKQTEIGMIPDDWEVKEINETGKLKAGIAYDFKKMKNSIYPCYGGNGIRDYVDSYIYDGEFPIIGRQGELCGNVCLAQGKFYATEHAIVVKPYKHVDSVYLYYKLIEAKLNQYATGCAQPGLSVTNINKVRISFSPTLAEQQKIAKALSDVDNVISTLEKLITKKKNLKQGTMQQLLTGKKRLPGFAPAVVALRQAQEQQLETPATKQTELGEIPADWEVKELGEICIDFSYGVGAEAKKFDGNIKYIRITDIDESSHLFSPQPLTSPSFYTSKSFVKENDLLFARTGASVGKSYIYSVNDGKLVFAGFLMRCNVSNADSKFIFYNTLTTRYDIWVTSESMRSGQPGLNLEQLKEFLVPIPSKPEQTAIANVLSSMDKEIEALEAKLGKYRNLKTGMMQQLLTGKIRLG